MRLTVLALLVAAAFAQFDEGFDPDEKWCGEESCYDILGVNSTWKRSQIKKQYRKLSKDAHPDRFTDPQEKADAEIRFKRMAQANEILTSNTRREKYDKYMRIKKSMDSPKESIILVAVLITAVSFVVVHQYKLQNYEKARKEIAEQGNILKFMREKYPETQDTRTKKEKKKARKAENAEEPPFPYTDAQMNDALESTGTFHPDWSGAPSYIESGMATVMLPWNVTLLLFNNIRWLIVYGLLQQDYSQADCEYLCYTENNLGLSGWAQLSLDDRISRLNVKDKPYRNFALINRLKAERDEANKKDE